MVPSEKKSTRFAKAVVRWTADGTSILGKGVVPDQRVDDPNGPGGADGDEALDAGLAEVAGQIDGN